MTQRTIKEGSCTQIVGWTAFDAGCLARRLLCRYLTKH